MDASDKKKQDIIEKDFGLQDYDKKPKKPDQSEKPASDEDDA